VPQDEGPKGNQAEASVCLVPAAAGAGALALFLCGNRHARTGIPMEPGRSQGLPPTHRDIAGSSLLTAFGRAVCSPR